MKTVEVIIPVYNEGECVLELFKRLESLKSSFAAKAELSFLFVNDGSHDATVSLIKEQAAAKDYVRLVSLSRNFGHQMALTAGLDHADADYIAVIDADLQDPPELLLDMFDELENGFDVVYGQRRSRDGESWFKLLTAKLFYRVLNKLCKTDIPRDTGDFRMFNRKVLNVLKGMRESHRFIRGMVPWVGFKSKPLPYAREKRFSGETKYPFKKMLRFALDAIFSFSNSPLRLSIYVGMVVLAVDFLLILLMIYLRLFTAYTVPGISGLLLTVLFLGGMQIIMLGVIGEYIGRIFEQAKGRPLYVVDEVVNVEEVSD